MAMVRFGLMPVMSVVLAVTLLVTVPGSARAAETTSANEDLNSKLDTWPLFHLSLGAIYAPAPLAHGYRQGVFVSEKLLDQGGLRFSTDVRLGGYVLLGGFIDNCFDPGSRILDVGLRGGAQFALNPSWALYALLSVGISIFHSNDNDHLFAQGYATDEMGHLGWEAGGTLGVRYRSHPRIGVFLELSGIASRYTSFGRSSEREDFGEPYLARLQLSAGVMVGFAKQADQAGPDQDKGE